MQTRTTNGPIDVNITTDPTGARSLNLGSSDGGITVEPGLIPAWLRASGS